MVTHSIKVAPSERTEEAITHLMDDLKDFECVAFPEGDHVAVRLNVESPDEWKS
jgi:hypothetical protein